MIEMTTNGKKTIAQARHEVATHESGANGKSRGGGGELFSDKSRSWHLSSILTIVDGKM